MMTGTVACSRTLAIELPAPPRGMRQSTESVRRMKLDRGVVGGIVDELHRVSGQTRFGDAVGAAPRPEPGSSAAALEEPRSSTALPDLTQMAAASVVTLGRFS